MHALLLHVSRYPLAALFMFSCLQCMTVACVEADIQHLTSTGRTQQNQFSVAFLAVVTTSQQGHHTGVIKICYAQSGHLNGGFPYRKGFRRYQSVSNLEFFCMFCGVRNVRTICYEIKIVPTMHCFSEFLLSQCSSSPRSGQMPALPGAGGILHCSCYKIAPLTLANSTQRSCNCSLKCLTHGL